MKWYQCCDYGRTIKELDVIRETKTQLVLADRWRIAKKTVSDVCFPTEKEAVIYLSERLNNSLNLQRKKLKLAEEALHEFKEEYFEKYPTLV